MQPIELPDSRFRRCTPHSCPSLPTAQRVKIRPCAALPGGGTAYLLAHYKASVLLLLSFAPIKDIHRGVWIHPHRHCWVWMAGGQRGQGPRSHLLGTTGPFEPVDPGCGSIGDHRVGNHSALISLALLLTRDKLRRNMLSPVSFFLGLPIFRLPDHAAAASMRE